MADYLVTWEINVEADSPLEAARKARSYQLPGTTATVFDVTDEHSETQRFDLTELSDFEAQPDHSPDAGKVVLVGWIWDAYGQRNFTAGTHHKNVLEADGLTLIPVYTHPTTGEDGHD